MPGAKIQINQPTGAGSGVAGNARKGLWVAQNIQLVSALSGNSTFLWEFISIPEGSAATINNATSSTANFDPDINGTYLVRLTVNGGGSGNIQERIVGVTKDSTGANLTKGWRLPAFKEKQEHSTGISTTGWEQAINEILRYIGDNFGESNVPGNAIIYQPGGTSSANVYATQAEIETALSTLSGLVDIYLDASQSTPYDFGLGALKCIRFTSNFDGENRVRFIGLDRDFQGTTLVVCDDGIDITGILGAQYCSLVGLRTSGSSITFSNAAFYDFVGCFVAQVVSGGSVLSFNGTTKVFLNNTTKFDGSSNKPACDLGSSTGTDFYIAVGSQLHDNSVKGSGTFNIISCGGSYGTTYLNFSGTYNVTNFVGPTGPTGPTGTTGTSGVDGSSSLFWTFTVNGNHPAGDPGVGYVSWSHATQTSSNYLRLSYYLPSTDDIKTLEANLSIGSLIIIRNTSNAGNYQTWRVTDNISAQSGYYDIPVELVNSYGSDFVHESDAYLALQFIGPAGISTNAWHYFSVTSATSGDPTAGKMLWNDSTHADVTELNISYTTPYNDYNNLELTSLEVGDVIRIVRDNDPSQYEIFIVDGAITDNTTYCTIPVTFDSQGGVDFTNNNFIQVRIEKLGPVGPTGPGGDVPLATYQLTCPTSDETDTTIYTAPNNGSKNTLVWMVVGRIRIALVGSGSVVIKVGKTAGAETIVPAYTVNSSKTAGTMIALALTERGSLCDPLTGYIFTMDALETIVVRATATGSITTAPVIDWSVMGYEQP